MTGVVWIDVDLRDNTTLRDALEEDSNGPELTADDDELIRQTVRAYRPIELPRVGYPRWALLVFWLAVIAAVVWVISRG